MFWILVTDSVQREVCCLRTRTLSGLHSVEHVRVYGAAGGMAIDRETSVFCENYAHSTFQYGKCEVVLLLI
jgi:hypothetical protein